MNIGELAGELAEHLVTKTRSDGQEFICLDEERPEWMLAVVRAAHGDKLPDNSTYDFIERCALAISGAEAEDEDAAREAVDEIESDCYTHDLTAWLHERADHVYYITQALEDLGDFKDGFALLSAAQQMHIQEVGGLLIEALQKRLDEMEEAA